MTLESSVAALREALQAGYESTRYVVERTLYVTPDSRMRTLKTLELTLARAESVFESILQERDSRQFDVANVAVEMTLRAWQEIESGCVADVGTA